MGAIHPCQIPDKKFAGKDNHIISIISKNQLLGLSFQIVEYALIMQYRK